MECDGGAEVDTGEHHYHETVEAKGVERDAEPGIGLSTRSEMQEGGHRK